MGVARGEGVNTAAARAGAVHEATFEQINWGRGVAFFILRQNVLTSLKNSFILPTISNFSFCYFILSSS